MDTLDIFGLDPETKVIVTIEDLRHLYATGCGDGRCDDPDCELPTIKGEIV